MRARAKSNGEPHGKQGAAAGTAPGRGREPHTTKSSHEGSKAEQHKQKGEGGERSKGNELISIIPPIGYGPKPTKYLLGISQLPCMTHVLAQLDFVRC